MLLNNNNNNNNNISMNHRQSYTVMLVTGSLKLYHCCQGLRESEEWKILFKKAKGENYAEKKELY